MENHEIKDEIRKEFQVDRMILFSDAVFAIVITLMAIEIRLPKNSAEPFGVQMLHLIPVVFAYAVSFGFIGQIWYQHLKVFWLLRDYDKGLIIRNLFMLFWLGFIPFSVTLIAEQADRFVSIIIYFIVIFICKGAQLMLQYYILFQQPNLRIRNGIEEEILRFKRSRLAVILLLIVFILVTSTMLLVKDPEMKNAGWWWFVPFPFVLKYFQKRIKWVREKHRCKTQPLYY
jgi:uncharacterized membrane protein